MKISANNFKGISNWESIEVLPINILTGSNSGGKSTWIQLILMIKQSIESRSAFSPLKFNNPYVKLGNFNRLLNANKEAKKEFSFRIELNDQDASRLLKRIILTDDTIRKIINHDFTKKNPILNYTIELNFKLNSKKKVVVNRFTAYVENSESPQGRCTLLEVILNQGTKYSLFTHVPDAIYPHLEKDQDGMAKNINLEFNGFLPEWASGPDFDFYDPGNILRQIRRSIEAVFSRISYIGPLREEPREFYYQEDDDLYKIGNKGENAAYILAEKSKDKIKCPTLPDYDAGEIKPILHDFTFEKAVNYWMCDIFQLAHKIKVERSKTNSRIHTIKITNKSETTVPITHVGFGVSQILPIVIEGLKAPKNSLLILEQPEIHLHPMVQSLLLDFALALKEKGIKFLIETHSDHLINRMRRRVAEDESSKLTKDINLIFATSDESGSHMTTLNLSDLGNLSKWPDGFFDQYEDDTRAIVKAQSAKRRKLNEKSE